MLPVVWLLLTVLIPVTGQAELIEESGSLLEFIAGTDAGNCAYNNWISHTSEANELPLETGNFAPPELDQETNGFGAYQVVDDLNWRTADGIITTWSVIFRALFQGDIETADDSLAESWFADKYEIVQLDDNPVEYLILREVLNPGYSDNNGTPGDLGDDVTGSFDLGWGLYVFNPTASNPQVIIEVVHPSTDYIAPYIAIDAFLTIGASCLFINGASRHIAWSGGEYSSETSLSDPSRNARTPFHEAHKAAVDLIDGEFVIQVHSYNAHPLHIGIGSVQLTVERENRRHPNAPLMNWDHIDLISLTPNPPVPSGENWPYSEVAMVDYYTAYYDTVYANIVCYPNSYKYRGYIPIPNDVDLPGTIDNNQMVDCHDGHDFVNDHENWLHIEFDEFPDVVRLDPVDILDFYDYDEENLAVPTYENYAEVVHYYRPVFTAVKDYFEYQPSQAASLNEEATFPDFYMGIDPDCAYENWVSHISEGIADPGYNDYGPDLLDRQTNGFGNFQLIPEDVGGDSLLENWKSIFEAFIQGNTGTVQSLLTSSRLGDIYELVTFSDGNIVLREVLNDFYFDDNGNEDGSDDVTGSFDYGWGLYVYNPNATCPKVVIEVVHPCDDYIAPPTALDAFQTIDAGFLFVSGVGREVVWTEAAPYWNSKSLSDPSRNGRHPFQMAHEAAVDQIAGELVIQIHSYDTEPETDPNPRADWRSVLLSVTDDLYPNQPLMDFAEYFDIISLTPEIPVLQNSIGGIDHDSVTVQEYYGAQYSNFPLYQYRGYEDASYTIDNSIGLPGYGESQQMLYSHIGHDDNNDLENWLHLEQDEFPGVIEETEEISVADFYNAGSSVPTYENFADAVDYYHPFYDAISAYYVRFVVSRLEWVMIGIPTIVPNGDQDLLFGGDFLNTDPGSQNWRVSRWDVADNQYIRYQELELQDEDLGDPADFAPGLGFWVIQDVADNCILKIEQNQLTGIVDQTDRYGVAVNPPLNENRGLTQIANPFHYPYDWRETHLLVDGDDYDIAAAADSNWISGYAYTWNSSSENYVLFNFTGGEPYTIDTWQGFWFEQFDNEMDIEVMFTPLSMQDAPQANPPRRDDRNGKSKKDEWALKLSVETTDGDYRSDNNIAGVNRQSEDDYDFLDAIEFTPMASRYVQLYFPHPDWEVMAEKFTYDYRTTRFNEPKIWEFTVKVSNLPNREFDVSWSNIGEMDNRLFLRLEDGEEEMLCDLREADAYRFRSDSTNNQEIDFRLTVGRSRGRIPQDVEVSLDPVVNQFGIVSVYPNPFNTTAIIRFGLPYPGNVSLQVYNLAGQQVTTLYKGHMQAGMHSKTLTASDLPSGLYFVRLKASDQVFTQKVMLIR